MRKLFLVAALVLPGISACNEDEFQSHFADLPSTSYQSNSGYEDESSLGIAFPELTEMGNGS